MTSSFDFAPLFPAGLPAPSARWTGLAKYSFVGGNNDSEQVPLDELIEAANQALRREGRSLATYGLAHGPQGYVPLREFLVTKLKRAKPDVVFHTGYNPDITLLLRQAREQGLKFAALVGHGAGYGVYEKLKEGLGVDANYLFDTDPISIWLANQKTMNPKLAPVIKMVGEEFDKIRPGVAIRSAHVGIGASNTYVFMDDVLPRAIKKYGGVDPEALRKASLDTDIPEGGTMLGFGVKFYGEGTQMAGQNERSFPVVIQYIDDKSSVVWPKSQAQREAVLPLPKGTTYSNQ